MAEVNARSVTGSRVVNSRCSQLGKRKGTSAWMPLWIESFERLGLRGSPARNRETD
jgi:hypothetical protein